MVAHLSQVRSCEWILSFNRYIALMKLLAPDTTLHLMGFSYSCTNLNWFYVVEQWLILRTHNTEVVNSNPAQVTMKTQLVRMATGNRHKIHLYRKGSESYLWCLQRSKSNMPLSYIRGIFFYPGYRFAFYASCSVESNSPMPLSPQIKYKFFSVAAVSW